MKMYDGVLQRVKQIEEKNGIRYAKPDGALYKTFKVILIIALVWMVCINLLIILGSALSLSSLNSGTVATIDGKDYTQMEYWEYQGEDAEKIASNIINENRDRLIVTVSCTVLIIVGAILCKFKLHIYGCVVTVAPAVYSIFYFMHKLTDAGGVVGLSPKFYWRHLAPLALIILCIIVMTVIAERAKFKLRKQYKKVTENLYNMYNVSLAEGGAPTDEQWDEFLKVYDPRVDYRRQFETAEATEDTNEG